MAKAIMRKIIIFLLVIIYFPAYSYQLSDQEIKQHLIEQSVSSYRQTIGNCPCPYNHDRIGRSCGKRSAWSKAGGYSPLCYADDVTDEMIQKYKNGILKNGTDNPGYMSTPQSGIFNKNNKGTDDNGYSKHQPIDRDQHHD